MDRKSIQSGFLTDVPHMTSRNAINQREKDGNQLRTLIKKLFSRLQENKHLEKAIQNANLAKSPIATFLKLKTIPKSTLEMKKLLEQLKMIESELKKLDNAKPKWMEYEIISEDEEKTKRKQIQLYRQNKQKNKYIFDEDQQTKMEIISELNYRTKKEKAMRSVCYENKNALLKNKIEKVREINRRVIKICEKQKQKEQQFFDNVMENHKKGNCIGQNIKKVTKPRVVNTSNKTRKFERLVKSTQHINMRLKSFSVREERKQQIRNQQKQKKREKACKSRQKWEYVLSRKKQQEQRQIQYRIKKLIDTENKIQEIQYETIKQKEKKKPNRIRQITRTESNLEQKQKKMKEQMIEKLRKKEANLLKISHRVRNALSYEKSRHQAKKAQLDKENIDRYDRIYAASIIRRGQKQDKIEDRIKEKHRYLMARKQFERKILGLRTESSTHLKTYVYEYRRKLCRLQGLKLQTEEQF